MVLAGVGAILLASTVCLGKEGRVGSGEGGGWVEVRSVEEVTQSPPVTPPSPTVEGILPTPSSSG